MERDRFPVVVHVLLLRGREPDTQAFLLRRAGTGFMDGYHVPPGGHQQAGETVSQAAARECLEETGATPADLEPLCVLPYRSGRHQGLNFVFAAWELDRAPELAEPEAADRAEWHPLTALPRPLAPWLGDVLELMEWGQWYRELDY